MRKRVGLISFTVLGAAMATVGLSGNLALAKERPIVEIKEIKEIKPTYQNGCGRNCVSVPEPSSLILLGASLAGLGIWSWRRKSK